jgi:lipopolysaccharide export system permease protein
MVFRRSLVRELSVTAVGLFLILLGILFTNLMLRLLARAAGGTIAPEGILALLGFNALFYFNILFSVALFVTVLLTLSRWYRDSEMIVWFTSGQGLTAWLKPILLFATPFLVAIVVLSLWLSPWAEQRRLEYERQLESRDDVSLLTPGLFKEFRQGRLVVFIESLNSLDNTIRNVFLHWVHNGNDVTAVAHSGYLEEAPNGDRFIVLKDGSAYEGQPGTSEFRSGEFERFARRIEPSEVRAPPLSMKALPTGILAASRGAPEQAELFWRLSVPISAFILVLLAVPLSYVNPRMGRSFNLITAAFMYTVYNNCLNIVQSFIAQGRLSMLVGLVMVHSVAAIVVVLLFWNRLSIGGLFRRPLAYS